MNMQQRICPQCGTALDPQQSFCTNCGHRFPDASMTAPTQQSSSSLSSQGLFSTVQSGAEPTKLATPNPTPSPPPASHPYQGGNGSASPLQASLPWCSHSRKKALTWYHHRHTQPAGPLDPGWQRHLLFYQEQRHHFYIYFCPYSSPPADHTLDKCLSQPANKTRVIPAPVLILAPCSS